MTGSAGNLPANLARFCLALRREHGFRIGPGELLDAARSLEVVKLSDQQAVRHALRAILVSKREELAIFDDAFDRFFFPGRKRNVMSTARDSLDTHIDEPTGAPGREQQAVPHRRDESGEVDATERLGIESSPLEPLDVGAQETVFQVIGATYSPIEIERTEAPVLAAVDARWAEAARALVRRLQLGLSRRWKPAPKGRRFDLRRTLRLSLQTGGEVLAPRWLNRPPRTPRFVLLIDGSRSMAEYAGTSFQLAIALARATLRLEVFTFSTALHRVTLEVRQLVERRRLALPQLGPAWGGGTSIGVCFAEFLRRFGERLLSPDTIVVVVSDGLDVGAPELLRTALQVMAGRSAALIWLNPLAETPGYEPTALGMSIARPFITTFTSANDLSGFTHLARAVRVRRRG